MLRASALFVALMLVSACASLRPYTPPTVPPAAIANADPALVNTQPLDLRWWMQFDDPVLDSLITQTLDANRDIRVAVARVEQARAFSDEASLDRFPKVPVSVIVDRRDQAVPGFSESRRAITTYRAGFDARWEIDLFGRLQSAARAASATAEAFEADLDDVRVSLAAEAARNYFELRGLQQEYSVAERSLTNQQETLRLTRVRRDAGIGEEQDVASAAARVAAIQAVLPPLQASLSQRSHRLAVLAGERPGQLRADLSPRVYPPLARAISIGEGAELLTRRPDVRAAERRLAAATGREGIAAADLYPRVTLTGFVGFLAGRGSLFAKPDSAAWAVTPALSWAGFDLGSARARLRGATAATRESAAEYEQVVLLAIEEVENSLVAYREQQKRLVALVEQARESTRAADLARIRYRGGLVDFLSLLDAERTQLQAEEGVAQAEAGVFTSVIAVYKSLGGVPTGSAGASGAAGSTGSGSTGSRRSRH
jgi:outer membrane protein, multidrug efflux system